MIRAPIARSPRAAGVHGLVDDQAVDLVRRDDREQRCFPNFDASTSATVSWACARGMEDVGDVALSGCQTVLQGEPRAGDERGLEVEPPENSTVQRPPIRRRFWSISPGGTISDRGAFSSKAIAGEVVTSVTRGERPFELVRSARHVVDASRKIVEPPLTSTAADAAIIRFAAVA